MSTINLKFFKFSYNFLCLWQFQLWILIYSDKSELDNSHFCQNLGDNKIKSEKISSLPAIIAKISKHLLKSFRELKLALILPTPVPELDRPAMTAEREVLISL